MKKLSLILTFFVPFLFSSCDKTFEDVKPMPIEQTLKGEAITNDINQDYQFMFDEAQCRMDYLMAVNSTSESDYIGLAETGIDSSATLKFRLPSIQPPGWGFVTYYPVDISILDGNPMIQSISIILKCDGDITFGGPTNGILIEYLNPTQINYSSGIYLANLSADQKTLYFIFYSLTPVDLTGMNTPDIFWVGLTGTNGNIWVDDTDSHNFTFSENGIDEYIVSIQNGSVSVNN